MHQPVPFQSRNARPRSHQNFQRQCPTDQSLHDKTGKQGHCGGPPFVPSKIISESRDRPNRFQEQREEAVEEDH